MARIVKLERAEMNRFQLHDEVDAKIFIQDYDGRKLLQISTYGRDSRQDRGKLSQTVQFDEQAAGELFSLLKSEFGFK
jgi:hypothetical protein